MLRVLRWRRELVPVPATSLLLTSLEAPHHAAFSLVLTRKNGRSRDLPMAGPWVCVFAPDGVLKERSRS